MATDMSHLQDVQTTRVVADLFAVLCSTEQLGEIR